MSIVWKGTALKKRSAWIVEWLIPLSNSIIPAAELRPYILPSRWCEEGVLDFMHCLWWNSALVNPYATVRKVGRMTTRNKEPDQITRVCEGARLFYRVEPESHWLVAGSTKNLSVVSSHPGELEIRWTRPAGAKRNNNTGLIEQVGEPVDRSWLWKQGKWCLQGKAP